MAQRARGAFIILPFTGKRKRLLQDEEDCLLLFLVECRKHSDYILVCSQPRGGFGG
jgi:hypothetical protein